MKYCRVCNRKYYNNLDICPFCDSHLLENIKVGQAIAIMILSACLMTLLFGYLIYRIF